MMTPEDRDYWAGKMGIIKGMEPPCHLLLTRHLKTALIAVDTDLSDARRRIAELEREREEARAALEKILAVRENPEPPSLKLFDIYHIAGDALATEANQHDA